VPASAELELLPGDWAVLGVIAEAPTHGFAVARLMAPGGAVGRVWSLPRPPVYQALNKLLERGLITERATEQGRRGPRRTIVAVTPAGRRAIRRWLTQPVEHVRDVRSLLLLKLALLDRAGADVEPLVVAQRDVLIPKLRALERRRDDEEGFERTLAVWRVESVRAVLRFLDLVGAGDASRRRVVRQASRQAAAGG
jgi:PadR family transcriptional regulator AphA